MPSKRELLHARNELARLHRKLYPEDHGFIEVRVSSGREQAIKMKQNAVSTTYPAKIKVGPRKSISGFSVSLHPSYFQLKKQEEEFVLIHEGAHMEKNGKVSKHDGAFRKRLQKLQKEKQIMDHGQHGRYSGLLDDMRI